MDEQQGFEGFAFEPVAGETPHHGASNRESGGGVFYKTGRYVTNVSGTEEVVLLARDLNLDLENFRSSYGHAPGTDLVAIYLAKGGTPFTADIRRSADSFTFYLHSLFVKYPELRPVTTQKCKLTRTKDAKGVQCLVFHANGGLPKRTLSRGDGSTGQKK